MAIADHATWIAKRAAPRQLLTGGKGNLVTVAARMSSMWVTSPWPGTAPTTAAAPTKATAGAMLRRGSAEMENSSGVQRVVGIRVAGGQPGRLWLVDRLSHQGGLSGTTTGSQTTNLATAALTRYSSAEGVFAALEIHTQLGTTATTFTISYTDEQGNTGNTSPATVIGGTAFREAGRLLEIPLAAGDRGVRAVADVNLVGTTGTAGAFGVVLYRPLLALEVTAEPYDWDPLEHNGGNAPEIVADACLAWHFLPYTSSTGGFEASVQIAED